jgi:hypothetical protein
MKKTVLRRTTVWTKIWRDFQKAYDKSGCNWPGQKKMIRKIVDGYFFEVAEINWKQVWKEFEQWCDACPTCGQKCNDGFHTEWGGKDGQEKELEHLLKVQVNLFKVVKKGKAA